MSCRIVQTSRGGGGEVGASLHDYLFDDELVRIDGGLRPLNFNSDIKALKIIGNKELESFLDDLLVKPKVSPLPDWDAVPDIRNIFLTHGHLDHVGAVPYILRKYRNSIVHATEITAKFCRTQWFSTPDIAEKKEEVPLFSREDAEFALSRIKIICPGQRIKINNKLEIEPIIAGHLLGAVSYIFYWEGQAVGFHTGDFTLQNQQRSVNDAKEIRFDHLRFLTAESTRITQENSPRQIEEKRFEITLKNAFERSMKIRIFTFAIGRIQELFALTKKILPDAQIYIDGIARETSVVYADYLGGVFKNIQKHFVQDGAHRLEIIGSKEPNIVLTPSAMQFGGYSRQYAEFACSRSDHLIVSPGYRDVHSPEYVFFEAPRLSVFRFGARDIPKLCHTEKFNFTSHCSGEDVLEMKARMNPDKVLLVHGDRKKMDEFIENHPKDGFVIAENCKPIVM